MTATPHGGPPRPAAPAGEYCDASLAHLLDLVTENAAEFHVGRGIEPLHQLRIATRKLRATLSFFEPLFHGDDNLERARVRLRKLALPSGQLRDLDVFLGHLGDGVAPVAPGDRKPLRRALVTRRAQLADDVVRVLGSRRWRRALERVRAGAAGGVWRAAPSADVDARAFVSERLDLWWWALLAGSEGLAEMEAAPRHRVRIEAKKMRYVTEVTADLFADRAAERSAFTEGLKTIQDELGALNDAAVAEHIVREAGFTPRTVAVDTVDHTGKALAARAELIARGPYWSGVR